MKDRNKITAFYKKNKRMPTYSEMADLYQYKSKNSAVKLSANLIESGFLAKDYRGQLVPGRGFSELKVLGSIKAGFPSPAEEELQDTMGLEDYLIERKEATYLLNVDGDSMIEACIQEGDIVIIERTTNAKDGQIVVAEVDGEFTMKYFKKKGDKVWLQAANKKYPPIYPEQELKIAGVVKGVIRKY